MLPVDRVVSRAIWVVLSVDRVDLELYGLCCLLSVLYPELYGLCWL